MVVQSLLVSSATVVMCNCSVEGRYFQSNKRCLLHLSVKLSSCCRSRQSFFKIIIFHLRNRGLVGRRFVL